MGMDKIQTQNLEPKPITYIIIYIVYCLRLSFLSTYLSSFLVLLAGYNRRLNNDQKNRDAWSVQCIPDQCNEMCLFIYLLPRNGRQQISTIGERSKQPAAAKLAINHARLVFPLCFKHFSIFFLHFFLLFLIRIFSLSLIENTPQISVSICQRRSK